MTTVSPTPWPRGLTGPDDTWAHAVARMFVRPLLALRVRPNHVTTLRILTGLGACVPLAIDARRGAWAFGLLWIASALLDRVDGELARIGGMRSHVGHLYDYASDLTCGVAVFLAMGVGLRHGALGAWGPALGLECCLCMAACMSLSEMFEQNQGGDRIWGEAWFGLHPDDALFLLAPVAWLGGLAPLLVLAAATTSVIAVIVVVRIVRQRRSRDRRLDVA